MPLSLIHTSVINAHMCQAVEFPGKIQTPFANDPNLDMILFTNYETVSQCGPS